MWSVLNRFSEIKEKKEKEEEKTRPKHFQITTVIDSYIILCSFFVRQLVSIYFKVLNSLYAPLGVLLVALHIFISSFIVISLSAAVLCGGSVLYVFCMLSNRLSMCSPVAHYMLANSYILKFIHLNLSIMSGVIWL